MFFEVAVQHLSGKFFKTHLWQSTFQQICYLMLATMLKNLLWWRFFKEFPESVKYSCCNEHRWRRKIWTSKNKRNNSKGAGSLCLHYTHSRICFCISCKSMKSKSWCSRMVTHIHEDILAVNTKRLLLWLWPFLGTVLKGWNNNGRMHIFERVYCGTFFNPKNVSCMYVSRSKTPTGVQKW